MQAAPQPLLAVVVDSAADVPLAERAPGVWRMVADRWRGQPTGTTATIDISDDGEQNRELTQLVLASGPDAVAALAPTRVEFAVEYASLSRFPLVVSVHSSSAVSSAATEARAAAQDFPNVHVVETTVAGIGTGLLAIRLQQLAAAGSTVEELLAYAREQCTQIRFIAVPDRFDPERRRRITAAVLLSGRPLLTGERGSIVARGRVRSRGKALVAVQRYVREHSPAGRPFHLAMGHGDAPGAVDVFLDAIERVRPVAHTELVGRLGPRLIRRLGARGVAAAWIVDEYGAAVEGHA